MARPAGTSLSSDNSARDGQLRREGFETNTYPTATLVIPQPIARDGVPAEGDTITATAVGDRTPHGVTRRVSSPLDGQRTGGYAAVVGSLDIVLAAFGIQKPSSARVLGIDDHGLLELQLDFQQGSQGSCSATPKMTGSTGNTSRRGHRRGVARPARQPVKTYVAEH